MLPVIPKPHSRVWLRTAFQAVTSSSVAAADSSALPSAILGAEHIFRWLPRGTHDWKKFVAPRELEQHLGPLGFQVVERAGVELRVPSMRWRIGDDCSATYLQFHRRLA